MINESTIRKSRVHGTCLNCKELYRRDVRNRERQLYCCKPDCRKVSKQRSQAKWLSRPENRDYFKGSANGDRVRAWRANHPGYWKRSKKPRGGAKQESSKTQPVEKEEDKVSRSLVTQKRPLQEILIIQEPLIVGLIDFVAGGALQENMEKTIGMLFSRGQDLLGQRRPGGTFNPRRLHEVKVSESAAPA